MPLITVQDYIRPRTPKEAVDALSSNAGKAKIIAGGTMIHELAERGLLPHINVLVDIAGIGLDSVRDNEDEICIGSASIIADLVDNKSFHTPPYMAFCDALKNLRPVQVRNVATLGGGICSALSYLDMPIALCAIGAKLRILGPDGVRVSNIRNFFRDMFVPELTENELLLEVFLPRENGRTASSFLKIGRTTSDYGVVNLATKITIDKSSQCLDAAVFIGNMDKTPYRAKEAEAVLKGNPIDQETIEKAMRVTPAMDPIPSIHASSGYKKELVKILLRDAIQLAHMRITKV